MEPPDMNSEENIEASSRMWQLLDWSVKICLFDVCLADSRFAPFWLSLQIIAM